MALPDEALPTGLRLQVESAYGIAIAASARLVDMGDECDVWRVETTRRALVVRASPATRGGAALNWSHRLLAHVAARVPEAIAPLAMLDGRTYLQWHDRPVSVYEWVDGEPATIGMPFLCETAARLLARLHRAMQGWSELSPTRLSAGSGQAGPVDDELDRLLLKIERSGDLVRGAIHGDYYPRNLICRERRIVGVIDWDESHSDLLAQELAWAVWEFAQDALDADLNLDRARRFVAAYADEGGPISDDERRLIVPLIRKRLREEVDQAAAWVARGATIDRDYMDREIAAFHNLREVHIEW